MMLSDIADKIRFMGLGAKILILVVLSAVICASAIIVSNIVSDNGNFKITDTIMDIQQTTVGNTTVEVILFFQHSQISLNSVNNDSCNVTLSYFTYIMQNHIGWNVTVIYHLDFNTDSFMLESYKLNYKMTD